uniref:Uncharacterized protein n=1 Tax=Myotis myotis TaxID=51298 RepID=A0A7J7RRY4_MYOMY|nr:hypothetical protein mMyoMyo1_010232 [Myotis myotis]
MPRQGGSVVECQPMNQIVRVRFLVRAHAQAVGSIPSTGPAGGSGEHRHTPTHARTWTDAWDALRVTCFSSCSVSRPLCWYCSSYRTLWARGTGHAPHPPARPPVGRISKQAYEVARNHKQ